MDERPARVLIADDHAPTRAGVRWALERDSYTICSEVGDAEGAIAAAIRERPDICLVDVNMPGNGIKAVRGIVAAVPETVVVMLTVSRDDNDLFDALRAGAHGYLLKDIEPERLPHALRAVLEGEAALPRSLTLKVIDEFRNREKRRHLPLVGRRSIELTEKEWDVLDLMRGGCTTAEIAQRMFVTPATVRTHIAAILHKLQVSSRAEALKLMDGG